MLQASVWANDESSKRDSYPWEPEWSRVSHLTFQTVKIRDYKASSWRKD